MHENENKLEKCLGFILIFICGIIIGAGLTVVAERGVIKNSIENPQRARMMPVRKFARQANLTDK